MFFDKKFPFVWADVCYTFFKRNRPALGRERSCRNGTTHCRIYRLWEHGPGHGKGILQAGVLEGAQIAACAKRWEKLEKTAGELGVIPAKTPWRCWSARTSSSWR